MPQTGLEEPLAQLKHLTPFIQHVLKDVCLRCVKVLCENTYGTKMPQEWTFTYNISGECGTATVLHTRLESDRDTWEVVFHVMNHGSRRYMIFPKNALALSWVEDGTRYFSKGHEVGGVVGQYFAEKCDATIAEFERTLQGKWQRWVDTGVYS